MVKSRSPLSETDESQPLRVLHIDTGASWRGGQAQVFRLLGEQVCAGLEVTLAAERAGQLLDRSAAAGYVTLPVNGREIDARAIYRLTHAVRSRNINIIHSHSSHALLTGAAVQRLSGVRLHVHTRRVDFPIRRQPFSLWKYRRGCDHIIAISEGVRDVLLTAGVTSERISVIHSGIAADTLLQAVQGTDPRREFGWEQPKLLALTVAALTDHKGHRYLLDALATVIPNHPELLVLFVGDGELRPQLERQAQAAGIGGRLRFTGFRHDVPDLLAAADVFILPSHLEGLCTSLLDAMAFALPVVATAVGGIPEAVADGVTGILVPPRDPSALARAIEQLLTDPELRKNYGQAGRERVRQMFDIRAAATDILALYRRLINA